MFIAYNKTTNLFLSQTDGTHYDTTSDKTKAKQFKDKTKVQNILAMVGHMINGQWSILDCAKDPIPVITLQPAQNPGTRDEDIYRRIEELQVLCQGRDIQAKKDMSDADKELVDMYHFIEFSNFNAAQGYQAYKMIRETLLNRRKAKDEHEALTTLNNLIETTLKVAAKKVPQRSYVPRIRNDLFKK